MRSGILGRRCADLTELSVGLVAGAVRARLGVDGELLPQMDGKLFGLNEIVAVSK